MAEKVNIYISPESGASVRCITGNTQVKAIDDLSEEEKQNLKEKRGS